MADTYFAGTYTRVVHRTSWDGWAEWAKEAQKHGGWVRHSPCSDQPTAVEFEPPTDEACKFLELDDEVCGWARKTRAIVVTPY